MPDALEQKPLSAELLSVMRNSGRYAQQLREPFITARAIILALLDDETIGPRLTDLIPREKVTALPPTEDIRATASRLPDTGLPAGEKPAMPRYDTLAFKLPGGVQSVWLSREGYAIFLEGVNRADEVILPKHLAYGLAAEAVRTPGVLASLRVEPGKVIDALRED
ncbi:MAG: hypothetical protein JO199_05235 [Candidatus Eremiobacteraeota bacterium]|nr:hypothetical protein [Candidatus Eremiobacteraeota bacterium]